MAKPDPPAPRRRWLLTTGVILFVVLCGCAVLFVGRNPSMPGSTSFLHTFNPKKEPADVFLTVGNASSEWIYSEVLEFRQAPNEIYTALRGKLVDELGWTQTPIDDGFLYTNPRDSAERYSFDNGANDPSEPYPQGIRCRLYYFRPSSFLESLRYNTEPK